MLASPGFAALPLGTPISRVETGAHSGIIREFALDESRDIVITASDDKTLRVWDASDGALYRTYRIPVAQGHVGQLYSVDLEPRSGTIAVAGWTPNSSPTGIAIYFLDLDTGAITRVLDGLPDIVSTLRFAPGGESLCVAFASGKPGIACYAFPSLQLVYSDYEYQAMVRRLQWLSSGELIAVAADGLVRRYDADGRVANTRRIDAGTPASAAISPDQKWLAVGLLDRAEVLVLDAVSLEPAQRFVASDGQQRNLPAVAWRQDSGVIVAAGDHAGRRSIIYRFALDSEQTESTDLPSKLRVTWMAVREDNSLLVATETPALIALDPGGNTLFNVGAEVTDFSNPDSQLLVSADGAVARLPGIGGLAVSLRSQSPASEADALSATFEASQNHPALRLEQWRDSTRPQLNGRPLDTPPTELIRSLDVADDGSSFVLGGEWSVTRYTAKGAVMWRRELPSIAWQVNIAPQQNMVVAALSDGTLRWYDYATGSDVVAAYRHPGSGEWVLWLPSGHYVSSPYGDRYIGWHVNDSLTSVRFSRAVQFERVLYRPDILRWALSEALRGRPLPDNASGPDLHQLSSPRVSLAAPPWETRNVAQSDYLLSFSLESAGAALEEVNIFVNDIPVVPFADRAALVGQSEAKVRIPLLARDSRIRVEASTGDAMGIANTRVTLGGGVVAAEGSERNLLLISIGASAFVNYPDTMQLRFSANDALAIEQLFGNELSSFYDNIQALALTDLSWQMPDKRNIEQALKLLEESGPDDTVVLFLASHGLSNDRGDYFFVPRDATLEDLDRVYDAPASVTSMIPWTTFLESMRKASGRRYMIVDTCHAEQIGGGLDLMPLAKRSAASSFALLAAAGDGEESQEMPSVGHGAFTFGFLQGIRGALAGSEAVTMEKVFENAAAFVAGQRPDLAKPQTPRFTAPPSLREYDWGRPGG
ncbi:caspase family protein [Parahaliea maris]|uniref:caspase family protein n=1 Tax=Parahaliea maris TaxID=2716870 RepID=UPI00164F45AB|nr:caspase family protein [Parahaliea maris]